MSPWQPSAIAVSPWEPSAIATSPWQPSAMSLFPHVPVEQHQAQHHVRRHQRHRVSPGGESQSEQCEHVHQGGRQSGPRDRGEEVHSARAFGRAAHAPCLDLPGVWGLMSGCPSRQAFCTCTTAIPAALAAASTSTVLSKEGATRSTNPGVTEAQYPFGWTL